MFEDENAEEEKEDKESEEEESEEELEEKVEEIRIKDFSEYKKCNVCGETKIPYIELESGGRAEYTCMECYISTHSPGASVRCPSCSSECIDGDNYCWKCGGKLQAICPTCKERVDGADKFCRQCGGKL